jgi:hypothetical protein
LSSTVGEDIEESSACKESTQVRRKSIDIVKTNNRRRNSKQNSKIVIRSSDDVVKILPSVLLTYDEKFTKIGVDEKPSNHNDQFIKLKNEENQLVESSESEA